MRLTTVLMSFLALGFAIAAGYATQQWLDQQRRAGQPVAVLAPTLRTTKIVVATASMRFGAELSEANLREVEWPANALPVGAFASRSELIKAGERRVVLSAIEVNEPILKWKITGPGQRASLSSIIENGLKAVTIRVNDVLGVAGFVLPGDRVDVAVTRTEVTDHDADNAKSPFTDILLQHVRVLGVDQIADDRTDKAAVVKAVTLEVGTEDAQRLVLASTVGTLSLILRPAGSNSTADVSRVTTRQLGQAPIIVATAKPVKAEPLPQIAVPLPVVVAPVEPPAKKVRGNIVGITRATSRSEYTVGPERRPVY